MSGLSGFPEFLPADRNVELIVLDHLREVFELHGFASIETRAAEPMDTLLRKGEIDKEVYVLRRLQAGEGDSDSGLALHFDLTVPFARYVLENAGKLDFPFRRYQIQKVWRGERPQNGRYREFTQADIDIVAKDELAFHFDVEIAQVMAEALSGLPVPALTLQVSNRKILEGFYLGLGIAEPTTVMPIVDKLDKVPADKIAALLQSDAGLTAEQAKQCLALAEIRSSDGSFVDAVRALGVEHPLLDEGLDELLQVVTGASGADGVEVVADLRIARGLDYYTGTVFETRMEGHEQLGSICSGGRYDQLASDGKNTYPGVGISLGVSRLLVPLVAGGLTADRSVPSAVLVALTDEESRPASLAVAAALRARGIPTEIAASPQKFGKQIRYAERRGIPYVWFPANGDDGDRVRDIRTGDQVDADPATWNPPAEDLKPRIKEQVT
ncbi:histidyl-tRNA synthetase [Aeromicrobium panaciterrae]|uniref:Histidine--tRNA ligase n=1 Tax=Aeromicrobium panaciterrae TaxID=363861 RepID=A0ABU1UNN0_9ACTN|nr:histidine--tRNA ligase [Aeromicrobium panaciterrae]MDR7086735.1 histidyl-tRNA synthetase [Aeromicrobium panaciterrae]